MYLPIIKSIINKKVISSLLLCFGLLLLAACESPKAEDPVPVDPEVPAITTHPLSQTIVEGTTASLSVAANVATGATLTYQWQSAEKGSTSFTNIPEATDSTYTTPTLNATKNGIQYRVVVTATNIAKRTTSNIATISIAAEKDLTKVDGVIVSGTIRNLYAPSAPPSATGQPAAEATLPFIKFSFGEGSTITTDKWDIAFRATTIIVNGGAKFKATDNLEPDRTGSGGLYLEMKAFDEVAAANDARIVKDADGEYALPTGSGNGWYNYNGAPTHSVSPISGRVIVVKTHDGKYVKVEITSYHKNAPKSVTEGTTARTDGSYYTFRYAYILPTFVSDTIKNLYAPSGSFSTTGAPGPAILPFVKFSFSKGDTVPQSSTNWDIAFRSRQIIVNGVAKFDPKDDLEPDRTGNAGLYVDTLSFDEVATADDARIEQDTAGSKALGVPLSSYSYAPDHIISPIPKRTIVVRTIDGKYAKMEILSYYKDAPNPVPSKSVDFGYYTFRYAYRTDGSTSLKP